MRFFLSLVIILSSTVLLANERSEQMLEVSVRVKVSGVTGSGTVVHSETHEGKLETFILTSYHVVAKRGTTRIWDILKEGFVTKKRGDDVVFVDVFIRDRGRIDGFATLEAEVVAESSRYDLALLKVNRGVQFKYVAKIATIEQSKFLDVFDEVYVIGCSIGMHPLPTKGELTTLDIWVKGRPMHMTNAPLIKGNSGGGLFSKIEGEWRLIGVPNLVSRHDEFGYTTTINWSTTSDCIYLFLRENKFGFIVGEKREEEDSGIPPGDDYRTLWLWKNCDSPRFRTSRVR